MSGASSRSGKSTTLGGVGGGGSLSHLPRVAPHGHSSHPLVGNNQGGGGGASSLIRHVSEFSMSSNHSTGAIPKASNNASSRTYLLQDPEAALFADRGDTESHYSKESSKTAKSASSGSNSSAFIRNIENSLFLVINSLKYDKPIPTTISVLLHLLLAFQTLSIGSPLEYDWGEYGKWVVSVAAISRTFGFQFMPYEGFIAVAVINFLLVLLALLSMYLAYRTQRIGSRYWDKIQFVARFCFGSILILAIPFTFSMMFAFWNCDYETTKTVNNAAVFVLRNFPDRVCWSPLNGFFSAASMIIMIIQMTLISVSAIIFCNTHIQANDFFILDNPFTIIYIHVTNCLFMIIHPFMPKSVYFVAPIIYILISVGFIALLLWNFPFVRRGANSFYGGN